MTPRQRLRAVVWEMTSGVCEWPGCDSAATEMAHITPRGMGHTGYRDRLGNVMAACDLHAKVTDDLSHPDWSEIHKQFPTPIVDAGARRWMLAEHVNNARRVAGYDIEATQTELDDA